MCPRLYAHLAPPSTTDNVRSILAYSPDVHSGRCFPIGEPHTYTLCLAYALAVMCECGVVAARRANSTGHRAQLGLPRTLRLAMSRCHRPKLLQSPVHTYSAEPPMTSHPDMSPVVYLRPSSTNLAAYDACRSADGELCVPVFHSGRGDRELTLRGGHVCDSGRRVLH